MIAKKFIEDGVVLIYDRGKYPFEFYLIVVNAATESGEATSWDIGFSVDSEETNKEIERCQRLCRNFPKLNPWPALEYLLANKDFIYAEAIKLKIKSDL